MKVKSYMPHNELMVGVLSWLRKAESDFKAINLLIRADDEECPFDLVCFHAQQAAEKYWKALLVFHEINPPKSHHLPNLIDRIPIEDEWKKKFGDLGELTQFAVLPRYPDEIVETDRKMAEKAITDADRIKRIVLDYMSDKGSVAKELLSKSRHSK